jgi:hypothetical protein
MAQTLRCDHPDPIKVRSGGIERTVCEYCGHVSFSFVADLTDGIDRDQFAREIDSLEEA